MKLVSVIIPVYNAEKYIEETILSVMNQAHSNIEILLVNDGSTDNSGKLIEQLAKEDERIHFFHQDNAGVSIARNKGIENAHGDYLFFLDSDDLWTPNNVSNRLKLFESNPTIDWIFGALSMVDAQGASLGKIVSGNDADVLNDLLSWNGNVITTPSTICLRSASLGEIRFDKNLATAADQDFTIQLASKLKGAFYEEASVLYRVLPDSMSRNIAHMEQDHIRVYQKAKEHKLFKSFWFKQKCFSNLYWILAGSWWKDGANKSRGSYFVLKALLNNPFSFIKLFKA